MMLGNELNDRFHDFGRHWNSFDKIAASVGERLAFRRICRYSKNFIWPIRYNRTQGDPQSGCARCKIVPIVWCLRPVQFNYRIAGKEQSCSLFGIELRPGRG